MEDNQFEIASGAGDESAAVSASGEQRKEIHKTGPASRLLSSLPRGLVNKLVGNATSEAPTVTVDENPEQTPEKEVQQITPTSVMDTGTLQEVDSTEKLVREPDIEEGVLRKADNSAIDQVEDGFAGDGADEPKTADAEQREEEKKIPYRTNSVICSAKEQEDKVEEHIFLDADQEEVVNCAGRKGARDHTEADNENNSDSKDSRAIAPAGPVIDQTESSDPPAHSRTDAQETVQTDSGHKPDPPGIQASVAGMHKAQEFVDAKQSESTDGIEVVSMYSSSVADDSFRGSLPPQIVVIDTDQPSERSDYRIRRSQRSKSADSRRSAASSIASTADIEPWNIRTTASILSSEDDVEVVSRSDSHDDLRKAPSEDRSSLAGVRSKDEVTSRGTSQADSVSVTASAPGSRVGNGAMSAAKSSSSSRNDESSQSKKAGPFAARKGVALVWREVNMKVPATKKEESDKVLLRDCWGEVPCNKTTAIMGASGAGKTSLLNILAGRLRTGKRLKVEANVIVNNHRVDPTDINTRQSIAFVAQDDSLLATASPRECIAFSATLRLPKSTPKEEIDELTERMLEELGLAACADGLVGGALIKGISGGERKRTSVGVELVTQPAMIFLDEPTSGLDSFSAIQCCEVLSRVAKSGASVLFTIHQPASEVFEAFDHLILMNKGRVMYQGPVENVPRWFWKRGHPVPRNYNPADWVIDIAQSEPLGVLEEKGFFPGDTRRMGKPRSHKDDEDVFGRPVRRQRSDDVTTMKQVGLLFKRELLNLKRDWSIIFIRGFLSGFLALFIGLLFFGVGAHEPKGPVEERTTAQSQFGAMMILLVVSQMTAVQMGNFTYPDERPLFLREYSTRHYSVFAYAVSHLVMELVTTGLQVLLSTTLVYFMVDFKGRFLVYFLAAYGLAMATTAQTLCAAALAGENTNLAMQITPLISVPQMLFAGFFVSAELIPENLQWAQYICTMTYSVRILIVEFFDDCSTSACEEMLTSTKADPNEVWFYWLAMVTIFIVFRGVALIALQRSAMEFY